MSYSEHERLIAEKLWNAERDGAAIAPIRLSLGETDIDAAYRVQAINTQRSIAEGRRLVGRKIGLTSLAVQKQLGVDQPDFGALYADMAYGCGDIVPYERVLQPKIEAEIAFVLGRDIESDFDDLQRLARRVDHCCAALEIVGSRIANWDISIVDTIADNASSGAFVLGDEPAPIANVDLELCGMVLSRRGENVSLGVGAACLGNPLRALGWLARTFAERGAPLQEGDIVLSGALGPMVAVEPGDHFICRIAGFNPVTIGFEATQQNRERDGHAG